MPVEKSGQKEFDFEYGDEFGAHIERFDPDFSKVLVRYNPDGDARDERAAGASACERLADWLHEHDRKFLFELLVPAEEAQLASVDGDADRYDAELRPELMCRAIAELQDAGVEADIWKIEGVDERADCERIVAQCRAGGRDGVVCVVLGRGADDDKVDHWLRQGAPVEGYVGFAIGRSIWDDPLRASSTAACHARTLPPGWRTTTCASSRSTTPPRPRSARATSSAAGSASAPASPAGGAAGSRISS